jgi:hypothetical protein
VSDQAGPGRGRRAVFRCVVRGKNASCIVDARARDACRPAFRLLHFRRGASRARGVRTTTPPGTGSVSAAPSCFVWSVASVRRSMTAWTWMRSRGRWVWVGPSLRACACACGARPNFCARP